MSIKLTDKLYAATGSKVLADAIQIAGGYMSTTEAERLNLTDAQKVVGTLVYETDTKKTYRYNGNNVWEDLDDISGYIWEKYNAVANEIFVYEVDVKETVNATRWTTYESSFDVMHGSSNGTLTITGEQSMNGISPDSAGVNDQGAVYEVYENPEEVQVEVIKTITVESDIFYENETSALGGVIKSLKTTRTDGYKKGTFTNQIVIDDEIDHLPENGYNEEDNYWYVRITDNLATETYVDNKVASLVNSAPETLDTLNELAEALGNDENFATTVTNEIGKKANKATSIAGYGITNAYTKYEVDELIRNSHTGYIWEEYNVDYSTGLYRYTIKVRNVVTDEYGNITEEWWADGIDYGESSDYYEVGDEISGGGIVTDRTVVQAPTLKTTPTGKYVINDNVNYLPDDGFNETDGYWYVKIDNLDVESIKDSLKNTLTASNIVNVNDVSSIQHNIKIEANIKKENLLTLPYDFTNEELSAFSGVRSTVDEDGSIRFNDPITENRNLNATFKIKTLTLPDGTYTIGGYKMAPISFVGWGYAGSDEIVGSDTVFTLNEQTDIDVYINLNYTSLADDKLNIHSIVKPFLVQCEPDEVVDKDYWISSLPFAAYGQNLLDVNKRYRRTGCIAIDESTIQAEMEGFGYAGLSFTYLNGLIQALDGKDITLSFDVSDSDESKKYYPELVLYYTNGDGVIATGHEFDTSCTLHLDHQGRTVSFLHIRPIRTHLGTENFDSETIVSNIQLVIGSERKDYLKPQIAERQAKNSNYELENYYPTTTVVVEDKNTAEIKIEYVSNVISTMKDYTYSKEDVDSKFILKNDYDISNNYSNRLNGFASGERHICLDKLSTNENEIDISTNTPATLNVFGKNLLNLTMFSVDGGTKISNNSFTTAKTNTNVFTTQLNSILQALDGKTIVVSRKKLENESSFYIVTYFTDGSSKSYSTDAVYSGNTRKLIVKLNHEGKQVNNLYIRPAWYRPAGTVIEDLQIEIAEDYTGFVPFQSLNKYTLTANENITIPSMYPVVNILSEEDGVTINAKYNKDINSLLPEVENLVDSRIDEVVNGAPEALDTLNELAAAFEGDISTNLSQKILKNEENISNLSSDLLSSEDKLNERIDNVADNVGYRTILETTDNAVITSIHPLEKTIKVEAPDANAIFAYCGNLLNLNESNLNKAWVVDANKYIVPDSSPMDGGTCQFIYSKGSYVVNLINKALQVAPIYIGFSRTVSPNKPGKSVVIFYTNGSSSTITDSNCERIAIASEVSSIYIRPVGTPGDSSGFYGTIENLQLTLSFSPDPDLTFVPYHSSTPKVYLPEEFDKIEYLSPQTKLVQNPQNALMKIEYNKDTNIVIDDIKVELDNKVDKEDVEVLLSDIETNGYIWEQYNVDLSTILYNYSVRFDTYNIETGELFSSEIKNYTNISNFYELGHISGSSGFEGELIIGSIEVLSREIAQMPKTTLTGRHIINDDINYLPENGYNEEDGYWYVRITDSLATEGYVDEKLTSTYTKTEVNELIRNSHIGYIWEKYNAVEREVYVYDVDVIETVNAIEYTLFEPLMGTTRQITITYEELENGVSIDQYLEGVEYVENSREVQVEVTKTKTVESEIFYETGSSAFDGTITALTETKIDGFKPANTTETYVVNSNISYLPENGYNEEDGYWYVRFIGSLPTKEYVDTKVAAIVNSAPETLDTLNELAEALGNDENFATTVTNQIAKKANKASTLAGYGITNAYTKDEVDELVENSHIGYIWEEYNVDYSTGVYRYEVGFDMLVDPEYNIYEWTVFDAGEDSTYYEIGDTWQGMSGYEIVSRTVVQSPTAKTTPTGKYVINNDINYLPENGYNEKFNLWYIRNTDSLVTKDYVNNSHTGYIWRQYNVSGEILYNYITRHDNYEYVWEKITIPGGDWNKDPITEEVIVNVENQFDENKQYTDDNGNFIYYNLIETKFISSDEIKVENIAEFYEIGSLDSNGNEVLSREITRLPTKATSTGVYIMNKDISYLPEDGYNMDDDYYYVKIEIPCDKPQTSSITLASDSWIQANEVSYVENDSTVYLSNFFSYIQNTDIVYENPEDKTILIELSEDATLDQRKAAESVHIYKKFYGDSTATEKKLCIGITTDNAPTVDIPIEVVVM